MNIVLITSFFMIAPKASRAQNALLALGADIEIKQEILVDLVCIVVDCGADYWVCEKGYVSREEIPLPPF